MNATEAPPFQPAVFAREVEAAALDDDWTIRHLSDCASGPRPWFTRLARTGPQAPSLYLSAGIHGDEFSGPLALLELLRRPGFFAPFHVAIFPILNPDGLARGTRENADGVDLNRDYRGPKSPEIASHVEALRSLGRYDATMMLHEDYEGIGAYVFELNDGLAPTLGTRILAAMGTHVPIDLRSTIDDFPAHDGVISRKDIIALFGPIEERPDWAEAAYITVHHTNVCYTTETPKPFPLVDRVAAQIAAVETLAAALQEEVQRS